MNYSIYNADRTTHLKIGVIALVASIGVAGLGITVHVSSDDGYSRTAHILKAGQPSSRADGLPSRCPSSRAFCPA
jgi:hypothetical protein